MRCSQTFSLGAAISGAPENSSFMRCVLERFLSS
jgi:hypothetical protein